MTGVANHALDLPSVIMKNIRNSNPAREPTPLQLNNKIAQCKRLQYKEKNIVMTGDLRNEIQKHLEIPLAESKPYIAYHEVIDDGG